MFKRVLATAPAQASRALRSTARPTTSSFARTITPAAQPAGRSYHEKVLDHYNNPRNVGSMGKNQQDVGTGLVGAPACGDVMKIQIKVDPKDDTITDVKFKTFGCGSAIASSSYLTELVKGMTLEQASRIRNTEIAKELCLPPVKLHCSMLAEDGIKSAINNYYSKNPKAKTTDLGGTGASMPKIEVEKVSATATA
ncbi:Iron sulfur cluster assembly protein 1, mitochondrial [Friedmanniomyces endolithicus]|uniref:Iron-sulfur cluster assembly protein n=1 Tax=Friedmanniomyces endolithicus TaxID=329885 RepID=A0A4U0VFT1_9PEZI|nr:iron-binding protein [Friedmanniomyces endolithicus]TKA47076.1 Iron sulfur cluster assembly protein 1, mitochondrial [Friedmanniomyces endolithicus]